MTSTSRITDYFGTGLEADRPVDPNVAPGACAFYYATDTDTAFFWNGTTWLTLAAGITELTGDGTAGPGIGAQEFTLSDVNGDPGTFTSADITVDAKGRVTAAANGAGGGGSGSSQIGTTQTASSSATLDITGITAGNTWELLGRMLVPATNTAHLLLRLCPSGGSTFQTTGYDWDEFVAGGSGNSSRMLQNDSSARVAFNVYNGNGGVNLIQATFVQDGNIVSWSGRTFHYLTAALPDIGVFGGRVDLGAQLGGFRIFYNTGNIASGNLKAFTHA